jgi:peptide/nickel transport system ATP-binding protein
MSAKTAYAANGDAASGNIGAGHTSSGLEIRDLTITYDTETGPLDTVRNVSLTVAPGEIYGLVGESGSGKTTLARAVVRYLASNGRIKDGDILLDGVDLRAKTKQEMRSLWGSDITMVHQDPNRSVNPSMPVGDQIEEMVRVHSGIPKSEARQKAVEMLSWVRMPDPARVARRYAHQLSGGQLQRVLIAIALITNPRLLIMDEPTTALDVTTEAVILDLIRDLLKEYQTAVLYITHNLGVVARLCHRVGVIYAGEMMEQGTVRGLFKQTLHPYTIGLLGSVPRVDVDKRDIILNTIPGYIPQPDNLPTGCIFAPRCRGAEEACRAGRPPLVDADAENGHLTACRRWKALRNAPQEFITPLPKKEFVEPTNEDIVLEAGNVKKYFPVSRVRLGDLLRGRKPVIRAVDDISVRIRKSFTVGIVGESGCGKTTFARCIAGLEKVTTGEIQLLQEKLAPTVSKRSSKQLKEVQMVFQNPDASLNPQHTVGSSVARPLALLRNLSKQQIKKRVEELFQAVNLPSDYITRLPHEISGGEKQRVAIARAFATDPSLMICDEPISSLDVSVQASLMNMLMDLQDTKGTSYLFISHDLAAVRHLSSWIAVIYLGRLWEIGSALDILKPPQHPYTEALFSALPIPDPDAVQSRIRLRGDVPSAVSIPPGCRFHPRCPRNIGEICEKEEPPWQEHGHWHRICCHIPLEELVQLQSAAGGSTG